MFAVPVYVVRWSTESCNGSADRRKRRQHCHISEITDYPRTKKSEDYHASSLLLTLKRPLLVTGDVIVEFFNKPKMMKKVLRSVNKCCCCCLFIVVVIVIIQVFVCILLLLLLLCYVFLSLRRR